MKRILAAIALGATLIATGAACDPTGGRDTHNMSENQFEKWCNKKGGVTVTDIKEYDYGRMTRQDCRVPRSAKIAKSDPDWMMHSKHYKEISHWIGEPGEGN